MMQSLLSRLDKILIVIVALIMAGCQSVDDERIPYSDVRLTFDTQGKWDIYGVGGAAESKRFIKSSRIPAGFPYTDIDRTGYGGLLLVRDALNEVVAYDLACPYEIRPNVRVSVPAGATYAECEGCGSTFEIFTNHGYPRSGPAAERGYALKRYSVVYGGALDYLVVTR